ncbi:hypothetical protein MMC13_006493 [Lambiella insularis]|nr:hypothetical protein [Lambiella insularis]
MATSPLSDKVPDIAAAADFKFVKVRKPDGTIVKVKRPISKALPNAVSIGGAEKASATTPPEVNLPAAAESHACAKVSAKDESLVDTRLVLHEKPASQHVVPESHPRKSTISKMPTVDAPASRPVAASTMASSATVTPQRPPPHARPGSTYRLFRRLNRIGHHAKTVMDNFDTSQDYGGDGDNAAPDSDDDADSDSVTSDSNRSDQTGRDDSLTRPTNRNGDGNSIGSANNFEWRDCNTMSADNARYENDHGRKASLGQGKSLHRAPHNVTHMAKPHAIPAKSPNVKICEEEIKAVVGEEVDQCGHTMAPKPVQRLSKVAQYLIWIIMVLIPLLFVVLGIMTAVLTGKPANTRMGTSISEANKIAVSLWPIVFAAILAQSLKMFASYKVERGLRLMTLEQLISSHSVASAIKQPFLLRKINWLSLVLLCLWSLSPLAGQALLRMSYVVTGGATSPTLLHYQDTVQYNVAFGAGGDNYTAGGYSAEIDGIYGALLLSPLIEQQEDGQDKWSNPRIPLLEQFVNTTQADDEGWYDATMSLAFSSLVGIPIAGFPDTTTNTYNFTVHSSYLTLDCHFLNSTTKKGLEATGVELYTSPGGTLSVGIDAPNNELPAKLVFASHIINSYDPDLEFNYAYSVCDPGQSFVDSQMTCLGYLCDVGYVRRSANATVPIVMNAVLAGAFANASGSTLPGIPTLTERYIEQPGSITKNNFSNFDLSTVHLQDFTTRLAILLNSFWQLGYGPMFVTGGLDNNNIWGVIVDNTTDATETEQNPIYATSWGWLVLLVVSSVVLLAAGVAGAIWDSQTIGPDILGFVSSIVRHSKYVRLPDGGSAVGGAERARMLGDVEVMLQDVRAGAEVEKIVLGTVTAVTQKLKKGRLYK